MVCGRVRIAWFLAKDLVQSENEVETLRERSRQDVQDRRLMARCDGLMRHVPCRIAALFFVNWLGTRFENRRCYDS